MNTTATLPETGFLRTYHIVGCQRRNLPPIIPVSISTWWHGVKTGRFPKPVKVGGFTCWRAEDIRALVEGAK